MTNKALLKLTIEIMDMLIQEAIDSSNREMLESIIHAAATRCGREDSTELATQISEELLTPMTSTYDYSTLLDALIPDDDKTATS